jgi:HK97 family phage major capsid protein
MSEFVRLREQRLSVLADIESLIAGAENAARDFTPDEERRCRELTTRAQRLDIELSRAQTLNANDSGGGWQTMPIADGEVSASFAEHRRARRGGERVQDSDEYRAAFWALIGTGDPRKIDPAEFRVLSKATGAAGGFLVPTDFADQVVRAIRAQGAFGQVARTVVSDAGTVLQVPSNPSHGVATWMAENAAYTPSDEVFAQVNLNAYKAGTQVIVSEELLEDSRFPLDSYLATELGERIGVLEEAAYVSGDGSGKPQGILSSATAANISTYTAPTGNATTFSYAALLAGIFSLGPQYRQTAAFVMSDGALQNLYSLADTQQRPLWSVNVSSDGPTTFLGYPIYTSPSMPAPGANNISIAFGDWQRAYWIRRVDGLHLQRQQELYSGNGQVGFRAWERVDGRVVISSAAFAFKHSAT